MSAFDGVQKLVFSQVQNLFGDIVTWAPSLGGDAQSTLGLYKKPEIESTIGDTQKYQYSSYNHSFEYYNDELIGLKYSVDAGNIEVVTINDSRFYVKEITPIVDGKTLTAFLEDYTE